MESKKIIIKLLSLIITALITVSCSVSKNVKDVSYMGLKFAPLEREDFSFVGNLEAKATISGVATKSGKKLDSEYTNHEKEGLVTDVKASKVIYFAPNEGEAITGNIYENLLFNTVGGPASDVEARRMSIFTNLLSTFKQKATTSDPGMAFAYYALIEKYPDIDYFINVRFDRETVMNGNKFVETIVVRADALELRTD